MASESERTPVAMVVDWHVILLGGLSGVATTLMFQYLYARHQTKNRIQGNYAALYVEVQECGRIAAVYSGGPEEDPVPVVAAPLYRLPTICYEICFPALLSDSGISEPDAESLLKFYAEVQTFNRGLDAAADAHSASDTNLLQREMNRNILKSRSISQPKGDLYAKAINACKKGKPPPYRII